MSKTKRRDGRGRTPVTPGGSTPSKAGGQPAITFGTAVGVYLGLSVLYFLPAFLPGNVIFGTDYLAGGFFFHHFISERFADGELPKWVPYVYGGLPLFANPGSAFHPVHMLSDLVLPVDRVLPAVFTVQFWLAGMGTFLLARALGCRSWIAFVVGLSYQFTGLTLSWVYAGHDGRVMVATMAPLFFYFLHGGVRGLSVRYFAGAAATLGIAMLSFQIQVAYYLILAGGIWGAFLLFHFGYHRRPALFARGAGLGLAAVAAAFLLAAVNFLPFQEYVAESPRGDEEGRGYEFSVSFSMPPSDVIGFAVPEQQGASVIDPETGERMFPRYQGPNPMKLHTEYTGALVVLLLVSGFFFTRGNPLWWFFAALALFALSLALGGHTPLYRVYYEVLPGIKRFRAPDLALFVSIFSFVVMSGLTLERIARLRDSALSGSRKGGDAAAVSLARLPWILGGVLGLAALGLVAGLGTETVPDEPTRAGGWGRFLLFAAAIGAVLWAWTTRRVVSAAALVLLAVLSVADLWIVGKRFMHTTDRPAQLFAADDVVRFLQTREEPFRVWNVPMAPYRRHDNFLMYFGIEQAGGEHGNQLQRWNEFAGAGREVYVDWHNFLQRPVFLAAANVRYLLVGAEMEGLPWLREVHRGSALVYENLLALPRAYLVSETVRVAEGGALERMQAPDWDPRRIAYVEGEDAVEVAASPGSPGEAEVVVREPDRIVVRVRSDRPAWLVLAENYHAGWEARIDDAPADVVRTNHTFRGVAVPPGEHTVEFLFRPARLYAGLGITSGTALLLLTYGGFLALRRRRLSSPRE